MTKFIECIIMFIEQTKKRKICSEIEYRKEVFIMSKEEKEILNNFKKILPKLSREQKSYLKGYGEAMVAIKEEQTYKEKAATG